MEYVKIKGEQFPATISGQVQDRDWDKRDSKSITLVMSYGEALATFVDGVQWSIIHQDKYINEQGETVLGEPIEKDNSEYCVAGSITDHRNGYVTIKMGKPTEVETLQKQLANAVTEDELNAAYTEGVNSL